MRHARRRPPARSGGIAWAFVGILGTLVALFGIALFCYMTPLLLLVGIVNGLERYVASSKRAERRCRW